MTHRLAGSMSCADADALAGAWAFDALDAADEALLARHLADCPELHAELRAAPGAGALLDATLEPVAPSPALRARILASVGDDPAEMRPKPMAWYRRPWLARGLAGLAAAAVVALAAWNLQLRVTLGEREAALERLAAALSTGQAHQVTGPAGGGLLVAGADGPLLLADLPPPGGNRLYAMWLIDAAGTPVAVGTFRPSAADQLVIADLERPLTGFVTFAVTIEAERVEAPTAEPVLVAPLT